MNVWIYMENPLEQDLHLKRQLLPTIGRLQTVHKNATKRKENSQRKLNHPVTLTLTEETEGAPPPPPP